MESVFNFKNNLPQLELEDINAPPAFFSRAICRYSVLSIIFNTTASISNITITLIIINIIITITIITTTITTNIIITYYYYFCRYCRYCIFCDSSRSC